MDARAPAPRSAAIYNDLDKLTAHVRLACWLLLCVPVLLSTACIIPIPLEAETAPPNSPPVIAYGEAVPPFAPFTRNFGQAFEFSVRVDDPDLDDVLVARLFKPTSTGSGRTAFEELTSLPSAGDAEHPTRRVATFPTRLYCDTVGDDEKPVTISVVVSDFGFDTPTGDQTTGLTAEGYWVLTCQ